MKPEDKKTGFRFERKKHKHSLLASTVLLFGLKEGGCWEEVSVWTARWLLASFEGKGKVTFFLLLPFANLIRHFWAAGASLFTDECLFNAFLANAIMDVLSSIFWEDLFL